MGGMWREMGGRFKKEGIYVYLRLIHTEVWQKTTKFCKAIILQEKNKLIEKICWKNGTTSLAWQELPQNFSL